MPLFGQKTGFRARNAGMNEINRGFRALATPRAMKASNHSYDFHARDCRMSYYVLVACCHAPQTKILEGGTKRSMSLSEALFPKHFFRSTFSEALFPKHF
jgi:hypothetical protein